MSNRHLEMQLPQQQQNCNSKNDAAPRGKQKVKAGIQTPRCNEELTHGIGPAHSRNHNAEEPS